MDTVCQACRYQRKPADRAPDWECPSCGKAYAKTSHEAHSPLVIHTDDPARKSPLSLLIAMVGGLTIFAVAFSHQYEKLKKMEPSLEDFSGTTSISGIYSLEGSGKGPITRIDGKIIYCGLDYGGGTGSCFMPLKNVPPKSRISANIASINTDSGVSLYANSIRAGAQEVYAVTPEKSLSRWWFSSLLDLLWIPTSLLAFYAIYVFAYFRTRK